MESLLALKNISVHYKGVKALDQVDLAIEPGEIVALMGPNGAGKSTVLKAIFGLAPIDSGQILWEARKLNPVSYEVVQLGISFVPQGRRVFHHLTVEENLEVGGFVVKDKNVLKIRKEEVLDLFPALKQKRKVKSGKLSGGQQQMVALARGLVTEPKLLLLDEPSLGLAPKIVKEVFAKIYEINQKHQTTILVVEHNLKSLLEIVNRAYILDKGAVVVQGGADQIFNSDILEKVFLGQLKDRGNTKQTKQ